MSKKIGSLIVAKRDSKGLTREQLAKKAKVSTGYLSHIEADHMPLTDEVAGRIAKALGTKFSAADLESHNDKARAYWTKYRAGLKAKRSRKSKVQPSSAQATLPGFSEMAGGFNIAERVAELVAQALLAGQKSVEVEEVEVTPIFKKVK